MPAQYYWETNSMSKSGSTGTKDSDKPSIFYFALDTWTINFIKRDGNTVTALDLSAATAWRASVKTGYASGAAELINSNIDASASADGSIAISIDSNTSTFLTAIGTSPYIAGFFEVAGNNADGDEIFYASFEVILRNKLSSPVGTPPEPASSYYTKTQVDGLVNAKAPLSGPSDIEITDAAKGVIQPDRTTGKRYRTYIDNGIFGIEEI